MVRVHGKATFRIPMRSAHTYRLRYPEKYYIYKYSECLAIAKTLESSFVPKRNATSATMVGGFNFYDEICSHLKQDPDLVNMLKAAVTDTCYPDAEMKTMTGDLAFFVNRFYNKGSKNDAADWFPVDYSPNLTVDDWLGLLEDKEVFTQSSLEIMKRMKDYGGMATCTQLSIKYGETQNFYNSGSSALARRIANKTGCPVMQEETENSKWWPILYVGKQADQDIRGSYIWKLRDELKTALEQIDLSDIPLHADVQDEMNPQGYWWLTPTPKFGVFPV